MDSACKLSSASPPQAAWIEGVQSAEFQKLIVAKQRLIVRLIAIYTIGYMGLSVLAGFGHDLLGIKVLGPINLGFVLIAGNYVMSWVLAVLYARISANRHDPLVAVVVERESAKRTPR